ncbi:MAG: ribosome silencing factor [Gemmatimonadota bacterium]
MGAEGADERVLRFPEALERAAALALERKAQEVVALDLKGISTATDCFLLATGQSDIQVRAIAEHIIDELKKESIRPARVEGLREGRWILVDYFDFVVHVFHPSVREFYQLETLWGDAPRRSFED